jgi:hypothetical protein
MVKVIFCLFYSPAGADAVKGYFYIVFLHFITIYSVNILYSTISFIIDASMLGIAYSLQNPSNIKTYLQLSKTVRTFHYNNNNNQQQQQNYANNKNNNNNIVNNHVLEIFAPLSSSSSSLSTFTSTTTTSKITNTRLDQSGSNIAQLTTKARSSVVAFIHGGAWGSGRRCHYMRCLYGR